MSDSVNFLIVGSGCRETAFAVKIKKSKHPTKLFCISGYKQSQIDSICDDYENYVVTDMNNEEQLITICKDLCKKNKIDYVLIGSEKYLMTKLVFELEKSGIFCIAPNHIYSRIETSKNYARSLLRNVKIAQFNPDYITITPGCSISYILDFLNKHNDKVVVKPDIPMGGKGVKVYGDHLFSRNDILGYISEILDMKGDKEPLIVLEEKLEGDEFSFISATDGVSVSHSFPIADFKRLHEGNQGPNTGSMGCISDGKLLSFLTEDDIKVAKLVNENIIIKLNNDNRGKLLKDKRYLDIFGINHYDYYKGFLYGSFIKLRDGTLRVIEFNARLGDPEAIPFLNQLSVDFVEFCNHMKNKTFHLLKTISNPVPSLTQYIVPIDYPKAKQPFTINTNMLYLDELNYTYMGAIEVCADGLTNALTSRTLCFYSEEVDLRYTINKIKPLITKIMKKHPGKFHTRHDLLESYLGKSRDNGETFDMYKESGVDIDLGNSIVRQIGPIAKETYNDLVMNEIGSFGGCFSLPSGYKEPIIVSSIDGVGTKSIVVENVMGVKGYYQLGQDIVNHCVNDILVQGATPLFFMDYIASSKLKDECVVEFVKGISYACKNVGCVLLGGETAEMPNVYQNGRYDLVGNIVGIVDKENMICPEQTILEGDVIFALPSSGPHTNGYSLIRKILEENKDKVTDDLLMELCNPHRPYLQEIKQIMNANIPIHGLCHVTGGGFHENIVRILPSNVKEEFNEFEFSPLFKTIQKLGSVDRETMMRVFNCGWGMLVITKNEYYQQLQKLLPEIEVVGNIVSK